MTQSCGQCLWFGEGSEWRFAESAACQHPTAVSLRMLHDMRPDSVPPVTLVMYRTEGAHCQTFLKRTKERKTP